MNSAFRIFLFFTLSIISSTGYSQNFKEFMLGDFLYCDDQHGGTVTYKAKSAVEEYELDKGPVQIESKIKWLTENSYQVTAVKIKGNCPFQVGTTFVVTLLSIKDNKVVYKYTFPNGFEDVSCFQKITSSDK